MFTMSTKSRAPARDPAQGYCSTHSQQSPKSFTNLTVHEQYNVQCDVEHFLGCKWISHGLTHQSDTQYLTAGVICCKRYTFLQQEVWFVFQYNMYVRTKWY